MQKSFTVKLWKVMKICATQTLLALILCGISIAHSNYAQILDKQITISLTDVPFEEALKKIEQAADVKFAFSITQLQQQESVTIQAEQRVLRDFLNELFEARNIGYKVHEPEKTITLKKYNESKSNSRSYLDGHQIEPVSVIQITGTVTDATTLQPMAGVNIVVRGTTKGTTSDADGRFTIEADAGDVLIFSFIGYSPFEIRLTGESVLAVALQEDITSLKEVTVNAGYYETTREFQTGSIVKIGSDEFAHQPVGNPLAALQAIVPGLQVIQSTGVPGGNFQVRIRGQNSLSSGNDPLYIIDGVPFISTPLAFNETSGGIFGHPLQSGGGGSSPLNAINPADIESIEILKDADATSIYGSRGANGVILITTKKGKEGKPMVTFNSYQGVGDVSRHVDLLSTPQYLEMRKEAIRNDNVTPHMGSSFMPGYAPDLLAWDTTRFTDWQQELIGGTAHITDAQLSLSGGEGNTQFSFGGGYHRETTVFPGSNSDKRISAHMSVTNTSPNNKLKTNISINYSANITDLIKQDLTQLALTLAPIAPALYMTNGELNWQNATWVNPLASLNAVYESNTYNMMGNTVISYTVLPGFDLKTSLGYTNLRNEAISMLPKSASNPVAAPFIQNIAYFSGNDFKNWIIEPQATWETDKVGPGKLNVMAGMTFLDQSTKGSVQLGGGFTNEALMKNIGAASTIQQLQSIDNRYRYNAAFGRVNYVLNEKYIVNVTIRKDGSSRFGPDKRFETFGAVGMGWIFSKEQLIENIVPVLSFGKLRFSYGTTGNDQIGDYAFLDTYASSGSYQGMAALTPVRLANPDFSWEINKKLEMAIELGFAKDRIVLEGNYYHNRSSSQLVGYALPPTAGFPSVQGNLPATIQNTGIEIQLRTANVVKGAFSWDTRMNFTIPQNKLIDFPNLDRTPSYSSQYVIGEPLSIRKSYYFSGVDAETGLYTFEDINSDGVLNTLDRQNVVFVGQKFYGAVQNSFLFNGIGIEFTWQFVEQTGLTYNSLVGPTPGFLGNQNNLVMDRWTNEGDKAPVQKFGTSSSVITTQDQVKSSDRAVTDASFLRLKNVSISYALPGHWIEKLKMQSFRVFVQGQNVITLTKYEGLDPENTLTQGQLPPLRVLSGGIHFSF